MARYIEETEAIKCIEFGAYFGFNPIQSIKHTPTADVQEVVHARWVYDHWCEFKCSICGKFSTSEPIKGKEKFCPNCGAKMDLKELE